MSEDLEYEERYRGTQILWGRVIVLLLALALAFWLGTTFGGDGAAEAQLEEQRAEITRLKSTIAALEAEVAAVDAGGTEVATAAPAGGGQPSEDDNDDDNDEGGGGGRDRDEDGDDEDRDNDRDRRNRERSEPAESGSEYVVQAGDSLASIAQEVYGDPTQWDVIARANDLTAPYSLTVGETLQIPERP